MCIETVQYFAECIDKMTGQITATEYDVMSTVLREPIGVVGCISPWNYPLLMALWKISPSLAAGNSTILKPAEQSPLSCYRAAELFVEASKGPNAETGEPSVTMPLYRLKLGERFPEVPVAVTVSVSPALRNCPSSI